jgi:PAS domain S-box-containing protein
MNRSAEQPASVDFLIGDGEMARLIRSKDWGQTSLGRVADWPQSLRTTVSLCLASNFPINIIWGPDNAQIYNDGYRIVCGDAHPTALGQGYHITWESAWPAIGEPFERARAGQTSYLENQRMFLTRNGYFEETFFTFSLSPIRDESGGIGGLFHPVTETTATMLSERRTRALRDLTSSLGQAADLETLSRVVIETLSRFELDLPFLLLYMLEEDGERYVLMGRHGVDAGVSAAPETIAITANAPWPIAAAVHSMQAIELAGAAKVFGGARAGPYEEPPSRVFVLPIGVSGGEAPQAILVAGASSRLPMTELYRGFYELLTVSISAALATVRAREDERRRLEALAAIDRAKTAFFSNVSHEFRTPLTLMLGPVEDALAEAENLPPAQRERLEVAHRNALRLLKLVNALLDFSRIEAGRMKAHFEPTNLSVVTEELASNFRSACERAGLELAVDCPPLSRPILVDREMWEKIVLNLISNAFKFTLKGGITVALRETHEGAELVVRDTGVGIPASELPRVFERFHRVEGQRGRTHEGTGIGLSLVKELVTLHDGHIVAESSEGQGSAFRVTVRVGPGDKHLPAGPADKGPAPNPLRAAAFVEESLRWLPEFEKQDAASGMAVADIAVMEGKPRVVLADDNADMRGYVRRILENGGYVVEAVENGAAALAAARRSPAPDLVLSDVMMPELDGFQLLAKLRADPSLDGLLVILLSARAGEEARVEGLAAGADDYLVKPFSARELRARVDSAVRLARHRREAAARERELHTQLATQKARVALQETEQQLEVALEAARLGTWELDLATSRLTTSDLCRKDYGWLSPEPMTYDDLLALVHPDDRGHRDRKIAEAFIARQDLDVEYRVIRPDGEIIWMLVRGRAEFDRAGAPIRAMGVSLDITDRKRAEQRQRTLIAELNHRVKNTLASVQSLALQTRMTAKSPGEFDTAFDGRLRALVLAHDLLTANSWEGARLEDVIGRTLAPYVSRSGPERRIEIAGPPIRLSPDAAVTLHMAFHELATNAVKYGALSTPDGAVGVRWAIDRAGDRPALEIVWAERDGPPVETPTRRGFGSSLLEAGLKRELDGAVMLAFEREGLACRIRLPLSKKISMPA